MARILSVRSKGEKTVLVTLDIEIDGIRKKYTVSEGTYREIGCPLSGEEAEEDTLCRILDEDEERRAMAKALRILAYADNTESALRRKLITAGFGKSCASEAVKECVRLGYINEERQAKHTVSTLARELYGPYKMLAKLLARGYTPSIAKKIIAEMESSGEIDFKNMKQELLLKKLPEGSEYAERQKLLRKYGYTK